MTGGASISFGGQPPLPLLYLALPLPPLQRSQALPLYEHVGNHHNAALHAIVGMGAYSRGQMMCALQQIFPMRLLSAFGLGNCGFASGNALAPVGVMLLPQLRAGGAPHQPPRISLLHHASSPGAASPAAPICAPSPGFAPLRDRLARQRAWPRVGGQEWYARPGDAFAGRYFRSCWGIRLCCTRYLRCASLPLPSIHVARRLGCSFHVVKASHYARTVCMHCGIHGPYVPKAFEMQKCSC
jgi:hypothetical protein